MYNIIMYEQRQKIYYWRTYNKMKNDTVKTPVRDRIVKTAEIKLVS